MQTDTRRGFLGLIAAGAVFAATPARAAMGADGARTHIQAAVDAVYTVINSGQPPAQMYQDFTAVFARYADVNAIARTILGPAARQTSATHMAAYQQALTGYIGRKYGKRFREFIGGKVEVGAARPVKSFFAVSSTAYLNGRSPIEVEWHVADKTGKPLFFNLIIEGVNMLGSEREEIAAMLARRKGDVAALTADLRQAG